ncbi:MAG: hypothetical protein DK303_000925 [Chloroflexi bacterium]|nr:MAG: hypothetical protein DK303_000925 [Chloroflexota bacterium]
MDKSKEELPSICLGELVNIVVDSINLFDWRIDRWTGTVDYYSLAWHWG